MKEEIPGGDVNLVVNNGILGTLVASQPPNLGRATLAMNLHPGPLAKLLCPNQSAMAAGSPHLATVAEGLQPSCSDGGNHPHGFLRANSIEGFLGRADQPSKMAHFFKRKKGKIHK